MRFMLLQAYGGVELPGCVPMTEWAPEDVKAHIEFQHALNAERYQKAAGFFIIGVIIDQWQEIQLITRKQILDFNQGLPCKADVTRVVEEKNDTLAYFKLKRGPGGPCHGVVRVQARSVSPGA